MGELPRWIPHFYQLRALSFTVDNKKSGLFLDPGLGKTTISLSAIKILKYSGKIKGVLMIAPLTVVQGVWPQEIQKWSNFKNITYSILHGKNKIDNLWGSDVDIYLVNPQGLPWLYEELLDGLQLGEKCPFDTLWVDESTKFKNQDSKRFHLLKDMLPLFKRRHIMTGTPAPKNLLNLWSQMYLLDEGLALGSNFYRFRNKYFEATDWNKYNWDIKEGAANIIQEAISPAILDMRAEDYLDMPEKIYNYIKVDLPPAKLKLYKQLEKELFTRLDDDELVAKSAANASMKCHQFANGNIYEDIPEDLDEDGIKLFMKTRKVLPVHKAKIDALVNLVDELNGKPVLIAYKFKHDLKAIQDALGDDIPNIGAGTTDLELNTILNSWNNGEIPILTGYPASMGHGLNMQKGGNDICWFSIDWDLEVYLQFIARIYRQGVSDKVRIHHIIANNTVDEIMLSRLSERAEEQLSIRAAIRLYRSKYRL